MVHLQQQKSFQRQFTKLLKSLQKNRWLTITKSNENGYSKLVKKVVINKLYLKMQLLPAMP